MADVEAEANGVAGLELQTMEAASSASVAVPDQPVDERLLFCAEVLIGYKVEVQLTDGTVYEGIFHTMKIDGSDMHVVLKYAKVAKDPRVTAEDLQGVAKKPEQIRVFHSDDVAGIAAKDVRMSPEDLGADQYDIGFETDAAISRGRGGLVNRELVAWMPDPDDSADASMFGLEDGESGWDQFAVNERKFGYQTGWSENYYTVPVDKSKCTIDEETAARLAREIERGDTSNPHLAEERGQAVDDSGLDEEDKYSGVIRPEDLARLQQAARHRVHASNQQNGTAGALPQKPAAWSKPGSGSEIVSGTAQHLRPQTAPQQPPGLVNNSSTPAAATAGGGQLLGAPPGLPPPATASAPVSIPSKPSGSSSSNPLSGSAPGYGGSPSMAGSAPGGEIDPRKEVNKMRMSLTGGSLTKNSPYGTPKGLKSPLLSPLISDPQKLAALNLEPGVTKVDEGTLREFIRYKAQLQAKRSAEAAPSALSSALAANKQLSSLTAAVSAGKTDAQSTAAPPGIDQGANSAAQTAQARSTQAAAAEGGIKSAEAAAVSGSADAEAKPPAPKPKLSKLNPNAKPFTLNINAKPFVPGGASAASTSLMTASAPSSTASSSAAAGGGGGVAEGSSSYSANSQQQPPPPQQHQPQHTMHAAPPGVGMPPGLLVQQQHAAVPQTNSGNSSSVVAIGIPATAAAAAAAAAAGGPPPGLAPAPGRMQQQPSPPMAPSATGVANSSMQGQLVQAPPPPGTMHVAAVPAGALLPPGTVQGSMVPAAAVMQGMVSGAAPVMAAPHQGATINAAGAAPAGINPPNVVLAPQALGPGVTAMAVNIAPPPPGMMAAPPGMMPVAAVPRPPMAAAGPLAAAGKPVGNSERHTDQRGGGVGPHPPPRGVKGGPGDAHQMVMQAQQQLQGHSAALPPQHPPSMRGVVMTPTGPGAAGMGHPPAPNTIPVGLPGQPVEALPGQGGVPPSPPMPSGPIGAMTVVPPPMHPRGDGSAAPVPQMVAAVPGMPAVPMQQPMPPVPHRGVAQGPDAAMWGPASAEGYSRGPEHRGQEGHRMHREPRSRSGHSHERDGEHAHVGPGTGSSGNNHSLHPRQQQQQPPPGAMMQHYHPDGSAPHPPAAGPGGMHAPPNAPPHMGYAASHGMGVPPPQQHGHSANSGPDSGPVGRIGSNSSGGAPPGMAVMGASGMMPPHNPLHPVDGFSSAPSSGPNSGSAVMYSSPHHPPGAGPHPPPQHGMQPAPPVGRGAEGGGSFSSQGGPPSHGPPSGPTGGMGGPNSSSGPGQPGNPHMLPYGVPYGPGGVPHPSMAMASSGMPPTGMQAAMLPLPMMPPGMMAQFQGQPAIMMPYPGGPQGSGGMMMMNPATGGPAFMMPAGMQSPYMAYMAGPGVPPAGSPQARPGFVPSGSYPMPMSPGGTMMRPPAPTGQQQPGHHAEGHMGHAGGGPGTPTAPSPHGGVGRTPGSGNRDRPQRHRGGGGVQHEKRGSTGDAGVTGSSSSSGTGPPGVAMTTASSPAVAEGSGTGDGEAAGASRQEQQ